MRRWMPWIVVGAIAASAAGYGWTPGVSAVQPSGALEKVRVGYLHTVAVDASLWLGIKEGFFKQQGLEVEPVKFDTGIAESQALAGGSLDVAIMGAVLSNFPARGQGEIFLANDIESNTAQLWVQPDSGITAVTQLAGKKVATTLGTTAHVFLYTALKAHGVDPTRVILVNSSMPAAVSAFIAHAVPAVALWVPFDLQVKQHDPGARMIDSAGHYFPQAAILDGWVANNRYYAAHQGTLAKIAAAWLRTNEYLMQHKAQAIRTLWTVAYGTDAPLAAIEHNFQYETLYSNKEWYGKYRDGTVVRWIGQVEKVFVDIGGLPRYTDPKHFFDPTIYERAYQGWAKK